MTSADKAKIRRRLETLINKVEELKEIVASTGFETVVSLDNISQQFFHMAISVEEQK